MPPDSAMIRPVAAAQLRKHTREELLPLWAEHGWDGRHGGFHSRLGHDLRPLPDGFKRLVVQTRQLYCYSIAAGSCPGGPAAEIADASFAHLKRRFWDVRHGGWFLTTTPEGEPLDRSKDTYAHAFALLGLAYYHRLRPGAGALDLARETLELLESRLADTRHGGFLEGADEAWHPRSAPRRHNPHMHLLEALLALCDVSGEDRFRVAATRILELLGERLYPAPRGGLPETLGPDWSLPAETAPPEVEPGHHFEWFWLLDRARRRGVEPTPPDLCVALFEFAERHGVDPRDGGVFDRLTLTGSVLDDRKRVWPQTERLKALAIRHEQAPDSRGRRSLESAIARCLDRYVAPSHRGWREHADRAGRIVSSAMNATTVYHVLTALDEVARVLEETESPDPTIDVHRADI